MSVDRNKFAAAVLDFGSSDMLGLSDYFLKLVFATTGDKKTAWQKFLLEAPPAFLGTKVCLAILEYGGINKVTEARRSEKDFALSKIFLSWEKYCRIINSF